MAKKEDKDVYKKLNQPYTEATQHFNLLALIFTHIKQFTAIERGLNWNKKGTSNE